MHLRVAAEELGGDTFCVEAVDDGLCVFAELCVGSCVVKVELGLAAAQSLRQCSEVDLLRCAECSVGAFSATAHETR